MKLVSVNSAPLQTQTPKPIEALKHGFLYWRYKRLAGVNAKPNAKLGLEVQMLRFAANTPRILWGPGSQTQVAITRANCIYI